MLKFSNPEGDGKLSSSGEEKSITISCQNGWPRVLKLGFIIAGGLLISTPGFRAQAQFQAKSAPGMNTAKQVESSDFWSTSSRWTFGAQFAFALQNGIPHDISHIALLVAQPSVGLTVRNFHTPGFPVSRFSVVSEGILGGAVHPGGYLIGHEILLRLDGKPKRRIVPFFNAGAGVLKTSINARAPELSGGIQFNPQGGFGVQYFFNPQRAFVLEYRYMHMSNNGIQLPNLGLNASMITIGFRWLRRPHPQAWKHAPSHRNVFQYLFGKD